MTLTAESTSVLGIERLHPTLGAVITGVDAKAPLDPETVAFVRQAFLDYKVVFFRGAHLDPAEQARFAEHFGVLVEHPIQAVGEYPDFDWLLANGETTRADNWHSDMAFLEEPPIATLLSLAERPEVGGDTLFADLEAAYLGLAEPLRRLVDELVVLHDAENFQDWAWGPNLSEANRNQILSWAARKVAHPLAPIHPETGRRTLFAPTGFARKIKGLSEYESDGLLDLLHAHVTRPEYVVRWNWGPGDLAFWDNRDVLHRVSDDYGDAPRRLQRVTINAFPAN